jgi:hypothetical protein
LIKQQSCKRSKKDRNFWITPSRKKPTARFLLR